jgi:hypothetical protein
MVEVSASVLLLDKSPEKNGQTVRNWDAIKNTQMNAKIVQIKVSYILILRKGGEL